MVLVTIEWLPVENIGDEGDGDLDYKVIVFDGMVVVNKIDIKKLKLRSCKEFTSAFVQKVKKESQGFDEVRVIFDRYIEESLKSGTRTIRKGGETIRYKISDDTIIQHLTTKQFLSDIKTKQELTKYLSKMLFDVYHDVAFVVSYEFTCMSNISDLDVNLKDHCHEEADTCIVLHSLDVAKRNPFSDLVVYCCDTDVLLLLLHYFDNLCSSTVFRTTNRDIRLRTLHSHLGPERCTSLLGFHAVTGCDQTGKFVGFTKKTCWKVLVDASPDVTSAFRSLGQCEISDKIKAGLEEFVLDLYCKDRPSNVSTLGLARWYLFSK